jgi:hypothetical protein
LSISKKRKLSLGRDQNIGASGFQQRGKGGGFGAAHRGIIAGLRGAVGIGVAMPISGRFQRAGVEDAPGVKPGDCGEVVRLHVRNPAAR